MKKVFSIWISLLIISFSGILCAKPIESRQAEKVALQYLKKSRRSGMKNNIRLTAVRSQSSVLRSDAAGAVYYIFNINDNQGFIIVSGDDVAAPVLAYSENGKYDLQNLPPNFTYWMNGMETEIREAQKQSLTAGPATQLQWSDYLTGNVLRSSSETEEPSFLIQTKWNQLAPYNDLCPRVANEETATGCVATAMAQIIKFHRYPGKANPMPAYQTYSRSIDIPAIDSPAGYDWDKMTNEYSAGSTPEENAAVAGLMYHCGVATKMDYNIASYGGSGTTIMDAGTAFRNYFNYAQNIQINQRLYYSDTEWMACLIDEVVQRQRPVFYAGTDASGGGHAFVCDGYNPDGNYFHFNWGWGGLYDGWFLLNALNPGTGGAGSGSGVYSKNQNILTHITPVADGEPLQNVLKLINDLESNTSANISVGASWTTTTDIANLGLFDFTGDICVVLVNTTNSSTVQVGVLKNVTLNSLYYIHSSISCKLPPYAKAGNYQLQIFSQSAGSEQRTRVSKEIDPDYPTFNVIDFKNVKVITSDPATTQWSPQSASTNWKDAANWTNGIPGINSTATIPASASYPVLIDSAYVDNIIFASGAEIGRQDLLHYIRAHVQIDFGAGGLSRDRWNMLASPIRQVYAGDFCFGGYPYTFLRKFDLSILNETQSQAGWKDIRSLSEPLLPGEGFALWVNSDNESVKGHEDLSDENTGLGIVNEKIELPYFENNEQSAAHRIHQYNEGKSHFYVFDTATDDLTLETTPVSVTRNEEAYRLANREVTISVTFGEYNGRHIALIGNPFIATIDFDRFYEDNADKIQAHYYCWNNDKFNGYHAPADTHFWEDSEHSYNNYIAPVSSFFIERKDGGSNTVQLTFRISEISATGNQSLINQ
ncbi:hypothetical protein FACS189413_10040 [Bacteroidia bacterium]|nr:hypothetical protein FACS189413_10040 [Bacteroidia bacterium]